MLILGIESSCDETSASVVKAENGRFEVLSNVVSSQIKLHQPFGGVVPELAAREHLRNILPVVEEALECGAAGDDGGGEEGRGDGRGGAQQKIKLEQIDALAVTVGPGLMPALMIGVETAKALAFVWQKPLYAVNHMEAHVYANWIDAKIEFPAVGLIISGGHTELVLIKGAGKYKLLGQTLDDAAGECFDKVAKMLKIGYPGGPLIEKTALTGNPAAYKFPRPLLDQDNFNFSFSGLKTSVLYFLQRTFPEVMGTGQGANGDEARIDPQKLSDICASFQQAVFDVLIQKTLRAAKKYKVRQILLAGGVAANRTLRGKMTEAVEECKNGNTGRNGKGSKAQKIELIYPELKYCTDNAAMVAVAGYFEALRMGTPMPRLASGSGVPSLRSGGNKSGGWSKIKVDSQLDIT